MSRREKFKFTLLDRLLLASLLMAFLAEAVAEAVVTPLGASALLRLWTAQALGHSSVSALANSVGCAAVAAALPVGVSVKIFGQNALAVRLPWIVLTTCWLALYGWLLRVWTAALPALGGTLLALTCCGVAPLSVELPFRAMPLLIVAAIMGCLVAGWLQRISLRRQALVATVCFLALMARCAFEGLGEVHQRHALQALERTVDRAAAPGEAIYVTDATLVAPLWFYGSDEVRQQMVFAAGGSTKGHLPQRVLRLTGAHELPFPAVRVLPGVEMSAERVVLRPPPSFGGGTQAVMLQDNVPWLRLGGFISPIASPQTRILFETSAPLPEGISLLP